MSLLTDLEKMDTDLKQVKTDTNVALTEKGGTEVQNLNEIAEAVRGLPNGGASKINIDSWIQKGLGVFRDSNFKDFDVFINFHSLQNVVGNLESSFQNVTAESLSVNFLDKIPESVDLYNAFRNLHSSTITLVSLPRIRDARFTFGEAQELEAINGELNFLNAVGFNRAFFRAYKLSKINIKKNTIDKTIDFHDCSLLTLESVQSIIDGLATVTTPQTLTLHKNIVLTAEQKETIRTKGWTLAQ